MTSEALFLDDDAATPPTQTALKLGKVPPSPLAMNLKSITSSQ
jgi:hypothetical protein